MWWHMDTITYLRGWHPPRPGSGRTRGATGLAGIVAVFTNLPWRSGRVATPAAGAVGARGDQPAERVHA